MKKLIVIVTLILCALHSPAAQKPVVEKPAWKMEVIKEWQAAGQDAGTVCTTVTLDESYNLPADSPFLGIYGRQLKRQD